MRYFLNIQKLNKSDLGYNLCFSDGATSSPHIIEALKLAPNTPVQIKDQQFNLASLVNILSTTKDCRVLDERGQLEFGRFLYQHTFGCLSNSIQQHLINEEQVILYIASDDENILQLPWTLLAKTHSFLCQCGWSIILINHSILHNDRFNQLSINPTLSTIHLAASPKVLIVAPEPKDVPSTHADKHLAQLHDKLVEGDRMLTWDKNLRLVRTLSDFKGQLNSFKPQLVYFYGHGTSTKHKGALIFEDEADSTRNSSCQVPIVDFSNYLNNATNLPIMVYVNCCYGSTAGFLGIGHQIKATAVITNRTIAKIDAAQIQALAIWESIILKGLSPHQAMQHVLTRVAELNLSHSDIRWINPILYGNYKHWVATPSTSARNWIKNEHWHLSIDRLTQYSKLSYLTSRMLNFKKPKCLIFVWYGTNGQGIDYFHQRIEKELKTEIAPNTSLFSVYPNWPEFLHNPEFDFQDVIEEAFGINNLSNLATKIRSENNGEKRVLTYINHKPIITQKYTSKTMVRQTINPETLPDYFEWCEHIFDEHLEQEQFILIGISFIVKNPLKFKGWFEKETAHLDLKHCLINLLDPLETLTVEDIKDFLHFHSVPISSKRRDKIIKEILHKTQGNYEKTVAEINNWLDCALEINEQDEQPNDDFNEFEV